MPKEGNRPAWLITTIGTRTGRLFGTILLTLKDQKVILDMSTAKRVVEIRSYSIGELSQLYEQSVKTMNRWLKPHSDSIGKTTWAILYRKTSAANF